jgi:hypothetical protein
MRWPRWPAAVGLAGAALGVSSARAANAARDAHGAQVGAPAATLLYQNFPNPFPTATSATTCIWFDLADGGATTLDVYDLRGNRVRRIFPGAGEGPQLPAGRYGRGAGGVGCDGRFTWDGTDRGGRRAPSGVYLLRLRTDDDALVRKIVFTGG